MTAIEIHDPKPTWAGDFRGLARAIRLSVGPRVSAIHHIGSTSVPGLAAKDIVDMQVTVPSLEDDQGVGKKLEALGFTRVQAIEGDHLPPGATDPGQWAKRLYWLERPRNVNLHVRREGAPNATYALLFRDYLRATPEAAAAYEALKRRLSAECGEDRRAYTTRKDPECDRIMESARRWAEAVGWKAPPSEV